LALLAARKAAAAATSISARRPISAGDRATRPITGSSTMRPIVSTSTGAGSEVTMAPEATVIHTRASASLWAALRLTAEDLQEVYSTGATAPVTVGHHASSDALLSIGNSWCFCFVPLFC
jgi:hypothetical protein